MKCKIVIPGKDWESSMYRTIEWEKSVNIKTWEHDFIKDQYIVSYEDDGRFLNASNISER